MRFVRTGIAALAAFLAIAAMEARAASRIKDLTSQDLDAGGLLYESEMLQLVPYIGKPLETVPGRVCKFYVSDLPQLSHADSQ